MSGLFWIGASGTAPMAARLTAAAPTTTPAPERKRLRVVIGMSNFLTSYWWAVFAGIVGTVFALRAYYKTSNGQLVLDRLMLRMPVLGDMLRKSGGSTIGEPSPAGVVGGASGLSGGVLTTSDLGHWDDAGLLHVDGRLDNVVISGGVNVPAETVDGAVAGNREYNRRNGYSVPFKYNRKNTTRTESASSTCAPPPRPAGAWASAATGNRRSERRRAFAFTG